MKNFFNQVFESISPEENDKIIEASKEWEGQLPTLWLLGKTGAGKSTLIQELTGDSEIEVGNGFRPCTRTAMSYNYPLENPVLSFLDTRGLSESDYDPKEDIEACQGKSHLLIIVMKVDDTEQSDVVNAIKDIKKSGGIKHMIVVHIDFAIDDEALFLERLKEAKSFMIVGDNVGEHVFDKLLLETIAKEYHASDEFMKLYNSIDLIIAKGMGNYECLEGIKDERIFHLFKVKCDVVAGDVGAVLGSLIFMQNRVFCIK